MVCYMLMTFMSDDTVPSTLPLKVKFASVEETLAERAFKQMGTMTRPTA